MDTKDIDYEYVERFKRLGLKVAFYRKLKGLTQSQLAEILETSPSYIGAVESTKMYKPIGLKTLFRIADALEVQPSKLLED